MTPPADQSSFDRTTVLVVGAGPVGLALALELGLRGVAVTLVEERARTGAQPRAKTTNVRTMQHMRRWGIAERLRDAAPLPRDYPTDVVFATALFGRRLALIPNAFEGAKVRDGRFPEPAQWVPQYVVERVMRERLETVPCVRFLSSTRFVDAQEVGAGVVADVQDLATGTTRQVRADYLVGADGARSRVREVTGARMEGDHAFAFNYNLILRLPALDSAPPETRAIMYWIVNPGSAGVLSPLDKGGLWAFGVLLPPGVREMDDADVRRRVAVALGRPMEVEIVARDVWAAHRLIASHYRRGRMFLAGDACHLHPPFGGYGMNLGIADGVDLGWKLAATLDGWGGDGLLDSYEAERRPVHRRTIAEAVANYAVLSDHLLAADLDADGPEGDCARAAVEREILAAKTREFHTLGVVLGSRYEASPVIAGDGTPAPPEHHSAFVPTARPGSLVPHAWLADGSSLYDRLGPGYTLLRFGASRDAAVAALATAMDAARVPLTVLDLRQEGLDALFGAPLVLVRPDQHVAWRGEGGDAAALTDTVRGAVAPGKVPERSVA